MAEFWPIAVDHLKPSQLTKLGASRQQRKTRGRGTEPRPDNLDIIQNAIKMHQMPAIIVNEAGAVGLRILCSRAG
jgi:hypothetical protein